MCKTDSNSFCLYQMSLNLVVILHLKLDYWTCSLDQTAHSIGKSEKKFILRFIPLISLSQVRNDTQKISFV